MKLTRSSGTSPPSHNAASGQAPEHLPDDIGAIVFDAEAAAGRAQVSRVNP
jgi:hypothetical protein